MSDQQRQATVEDAGGCTAIETMSTCPDGGTSAMMGQVVLTVLALALIFESASRLDSEDN